MDTERRMTTQEMLTQHKKLMDEAQRLEPSVMVTERNWSAMLEMQDRLFRQQMQLDTDLKMLLTKAEAQESLIKMQTSAENFEKQAGSLNERYSSGCKALTETSYASGYHTDAEQIQNNIDRCVAPLAYPFGLSGYTHFVTDQKQLFSNTPSYRLEVE